MTGAETRTVTPGAAGDTTATVLVRYFAAARAAAGTDAESVPLPGAAQTRAGVTRREVEALLAARHHQPPPGQPPLAQVLARSSFLLDGVACTDPGAPVGHGAVLDVLPPFSGG